MNDESCIQRCLAGHTEAFQTLVERYERPLRAFLVGRLGRDRGDEATQETFVRAYTKLASLKDPAGFMSWLLGIAAHVALETLRQGDRWTPLPDGFEPVETGTHALEEAQHAELLNQAIALLPEHLRRMVLMRFFEHQSCAEIARGLGLPLGTVTKSLSRAYVQLRAHLETLNPRS